MGVKVEVGVEVFRNAKTPDIALQDIEARTNRRTTKVNGRWDIIEEKPFC